MKKCPKCGNQNDDKFNNCSNCGTYLNNIVETQNTGGVTASVVLGIITIVSIFTVPILTFILGVTTIIVALINKNKSNDANTGLIMGIIGTIIGFIILILLALLIYVFYSYTKKPINIANDYINNYSYSDSYFE